MVAMCSNDHASPGFLLSHQNLRAICLRAETSMRCFARCAEKFAGLDPTQYRYGCAYIIAFVGKYRPHRCCLCTTSPVCCISPSASLRSWLDFTTVG